MAALFGNMRIRYRLALGYCLVFLLVFSVAGWWMFSEVGNIVESGIEMQLDTTTDAIADMVETAADVSVRNRLRAIAEKNLDILESLAARARAGEMTEAEARSLARSILLSQNVGHTGYIYCLTSRGVLAVHPVAAMEGRDISREWLIREQIGRLRGFLAYQWRNDQETMTRDKVLYMDYFEPWDWIVSVSSYRAEFASLVQVDDFRAAIEDRKLGENGYVFVLNSRGEVILHPWIAEGIPDSGTIAGRPLVKEMLALGRGTLRYELVDPGRGEAREKVVRFTSIPNLEWIVGASGYLDEVYAPLLRFKCLFWGAAGMTLLLIIPLSFLLASDITRPLSRLTRRMEQAEAGDFQARLECDAKGEIGELARRFNGFMDALQASREKLRLEIEIRRSAEQQLRLYGQAFESALEGICITDVHGNIVEINPAFTTITGYSAEEVMGRNPRLLKSDRHDADFYKEMWHSLNTKGRWVAEIWNRRKDGESYPELLSISAIRGENGDPTHYIAVFHDITDMKIKEEQIEHQAYHDALTGLPNRILLNDRLSVAISHARRDPMRVAVYFIDLDNFKTINDSLGHALGDELLQGVALRLSEQFRSQDTVARLGGDEFVVMIEDVADDRHVVNAAERILEALREPFLIRENELFVTASVGITVFPDDGEEPGTLIRNADMAMYQAKARGRNDYFVFKAEMNDRVSDRLARESALRRAVNEREFTVFFQPKVDICSMEVCGMEALVRWERKDGTLVSPGEFIPLAEETGLMIPLGEIVLDASCKAMQVFDGMGCSGLKVSVNLSPVQFRQDDLVETIVANLERNGLPPSRLEVEITESTLMTDVASSTDKLNRLVEHGISVSIDDFGTGYSSLYYLKAFPISVLKIDRSFIHDVAVDPNDAQIVRTIILMAGNLGLDVVAEGVENEEQLALLQGFGCGLVQGYHFSRPLPLEGMIEYLRSEDGRLEACLEKGDAGKDADDQ
ncbi:bifunctional diguanylate cyclase/phosphodiesterase [Pseudodesulfovibrio tunisiensis]|uniref:bifunctional diguanylate cyclase/phosphodiesterase n=1 Tax=Pseudodesulfovibrio tunisiensis TaxID=463192 RepID=UPI001FB451F2|nr:EAL domain-containing protein [Pseudodesulfovibrio tunisiensis]